MRARWDGWHVPEPQSDLSRITNNDSQVNLPATTPSAPIRLQAPSAGCPRSNSPEKQGATIARPATARVWSAAPSPFDYWKLCVSKGSVPPSATRVIVYLKPINMRTACETLRTICCNELDMLPDADTAFVFVNKARDSLLLYYADPSGDHTLIKKMDKNLLMLPSASPSGAPYVSMSASILSKLFG